MSLIKTITSAFGKIAIVAALLGAFLVGLVSVVWLSLRGDEIKVPEIVGKDVLESEKELAALGLKLKRRANRFSEEKPNTILEQLPKPGETVKTGQVISVVLSRINPEGSEEPAVIEKDTDNANANASTTDAPVNKKKEVKKPISTTRDVESAKTGKNANAANKNSSSSNKSGSNSNKSSDTNTSNKNSSSANTTVKTNTTITNKPVNKPAPANTGGGDIRPRKVPQ